MQTHDLMADGLEHTFDLMLLAFVDADAHDRAARVRAARDNGCRQGVVCAKEMCVCGSGHSVV